MKKNQNLLNVLENVLTEVLDDLWTAYSNLTEDSSMDRRVQVGKDISEISTGTTQQQINKIEVITLDESISVENNKIDFIKIDVEGYELDVLIGGKQTINKFKPTMLIEINDHTLNRNNVNRQQIFAWLEENNYNYRNIYEGQGLTDSQLDIICLPK